MDIPRDCEVVIGLQASRKTADQLDSSFLGVSQQGYGADIARSLGDTLAQNYTPNDKVFGFYFCTDSDADYSTRFEPIEVQTGSQWRSAVLGGAKKRGRRHRLRDTLEAMLGSEQKLPELKMLVLMIYDCFDSEECVQFLRHRSRQQGKLPLVVIVCLRPDKFSRSYMLDRLQEQDLPPCLCVVPEAWDAPVPDVQTILAAIGEAADSG